MSNLFRGLKLNSPIHLL